MGTIGPKENPKPLILHVDSDTGIPYRLAESDILVVGTISATNYQNLTLTSIGGVTSIEQLAGTGIFETTANAVATYLTINTATATYVTQTYANANLVQNSDLNEYLYLGPLTATLGDGDIPYYNGSDWAEIPGGVNGQVLTWDNGPIWDSPCGTVSLPISVNNGGTGNTTQQPGGIMYFDGTGITSETGFEYSPGANTLSVNTLAPVNPLNVQYGGTNATSIENARVNLGLGPLAILASPLPVANGGTNFTGPFLNEGVLYFDGTRLQTDSGLTYKSGTDTATIGNLTLTGTALTVPNGGIGVRSVTVGHFLVGNGAGAINSVATGTFETTSNAANTYFNKNTDTLAVNRGGTNNTTAPTNRGVIFYDSTKYDANTTLKLGATYKLLAACGVAVPSKKLFIEDGNDNPITEFKLKDIYDVTTTPAGNGQVLTYSTGTNTWGPADLPAGLATPISISNGGTNTTGPFLSNGVVYFDQTLTSFKSSSNLTFNGTTLTANQISLNTPLSVANGGTNTTGPFTSNGIIYFNGTRVATESAFTYTEGTNTLSTDTLSLGNALTVANGGTGLKTIPAGRFLVGDGTNPVTTIATGTFETTSNAANTYLGKSANVTSLNGTGVFETTAYSRNNFLLNSTNVTSLNGTGVFDTTANATNYFNKNTDTLPITRGGTNATGPFLSNGVLYFDQSLTSFKSNSNLTFNGTTLTANELSLNTALSVANGGTGRTTLVTGALYANSTTSIDVAQGLTDLEIFADDSNFFNSYTNYGAIPTVGTDGRYIKTLCTTATIGKYLGNYLVTSIAGINFVGPRWEDLTLTSLKDVTATVPTNGQVLTYDTGINKWKPATPASNNINVWNFLHESINTDIASGDSETPISNLVPQVTGLNCVLKYNVFFSGSPSTGIKYRVGLSNDFSSYSLVTTFNSPGIYAPSSTIKIDNDSDYINGHIKETGYGNFLIDLTISGVGSTDPILLVDTQSTGDVKILKNSYLEYRTF